MPTEILYYEFVSFSKHVIILSSFDDICDSAPLGNRVIILTEDDASAPTCCLTVV